MYTRGHALSYQRKIEIAAAYLAAKEEGGGLSQPNFSELGRSLGVSRTVVRKVANELLLHGRVLSPAEIRANRNIPRGPGSKAMDEADRFVVFFLTFSRFFLSEQKSGRILGNNSVYFIQNTQNCKL